MLTDFLPSGLSSDGTRLRKEIPRILVSLVEGGTLIKFDVEYGLRMSESVRWDREGWGERESIVNGTKDA